MGGWEAAALWWGLGGWEEGGGGGVGGVFAQHRGLGDLFSCFLVALYEPKPVAVGGFAAPSRPFAVLRKVISPRVPPAGQSQWLLGSRWGSVWLLIIIEVIEDVRGLREDLRCGREAVRWRRSLHW